MLTEDLTAFFSTTDFATAATYDGTTVNGIFDDGYVQPGLGRVGIEATQPMFRCSSAALAAITAPAHGLEVVLASTTYRVVGVQPDGLGTTTLLLERIGAVEAITTEDSDALTTEAGDELITEAG
jgi:hypothetical protein